MPRIEHKVCPMDNCGRRGTHRGMCKKHYNIWKRLNPAQFEQVRQLREKNPIARNGSTIFSDEEKIKHALKCRCELHRRDLKKHHPFGIMTYNIPREREGGTFFRISDRGRSYISSSAGQCEDA